MPIFYVLYNVNMLFPSVCLVNEQLTCLQEKDVRPDGRNLEEFRPTVLNMGKVYVTLGLPFNRRFQISTHIERF